MVIISKDIPINEEETKEAIHIVLDGNIVEAEYDMFGAFHKGTIKGIPLTQAQGEMIMDCIQKMEKLIRSYV